MSVSYHGPGWRKCHNCGRFCGVVYRSFGDSGMGEVSSCIYCGINPPKCTKETGTVYGCQTNSTHVEQVNEHRKRYWCRDHTPDNSEPLPYVRDALASTDQEEAMDK